MDNNQDRLPNRPWNQYQTPTSSTNSYNNVQFDAVNNVWRQSQNVNNSANLNSHVNEVNYPNSNLQVSENNMHTPSHGNRSDVQNSVFNNVNNSDDGFSNLRLYNLFRSNNANISRSGYILPMHIQNSITRTETGEESNTNYSGRCSSESESNGSHSPITYNEYLPLGRYSNQPVNSASAIPLQCPTSYQNNTSSQTSTVTNSLDHQTVGHMNNFNISYNLPPPPINNPRSSAPVILSQNFLPPQLTLGILPCPPNNALNSELPISTEVAPPVLFPNLPVWTKINLFPNVEETSCIPTSMSSSIEAKLSTFLNGISYWNDKPRSKNISITKYREVLKEALETMKNLIICRENLVTLLRSDVDIWNAEANQVFFFQHQLDNLCSLLRKPGNLSTVQSKLERVEKKRIRIKKLKQKVIKEKLTQVKRREELHREIDKWLDSIKEKNLKLKRETEMKKEADSILSEVRKKIHEARRTIEKIKLLEKLRNARQAKAINKGLFLPEHEEKFQNSISNFRELMLRQLSDYEAEEKALKVMLEAEQEGQLEEEALWRIKKLRSLQQKRQNNILECLFGDHVEEPVKEDPIFLFYQFQNSGSKSIESLAQIRHQWDMYIKKKGNSIPQQWVVPVPPSSSAWEVALKS